MLYKDLKNNTIEQIRKMLFDMKKEAHEMQMKIKLNQHKQTHKLRMLKKDIARILTFLSNNK